eukprot:scaffold2260_cov65-Phaeocystis_antarctica.AAC.6
MREEYAVAVALAQPPLLRYRVGQAAARDGSLALCSHCFRRPLCRLVHLSHGKARWVERVQCLELIRQEARFFDIFREHTHLEDQREEQDHNEGEVAEQDELVVGAALERLGDRRIEENYEREDKTDDELHHRAGTDEHAEADEEQLRSAGRWKRASVRLLRDLDQFPPVHRWLIVRGEKRQAAREVRGMLRENGLACSQQQRQVEERNADRVQGNCNPCQGNHSTVLVVVAIDRVV